MLSDFIAIAQNEKKDIVIFKGLILNNLILYKFS